MNNIKQIIKTSCFVSNLDEKEFYKKTRERHITDVRRMVYSICRDVLHLPYTNIAKYFKVNHATIMHHYKVHKSIMEYDRVYNEIYTTILELVKSELGFIDAKELIEEIRKVKAKRLEEKIKLQEIINQTQSTKINEN